MNNNYDGDVGHITEDAYKDLNKEYNNLEDIEFDEPIEVNVVSEEHEKKIDTIVSDIGEDSSSKRKDQILIGLAIVLVIVSVVVVARVNGVKKTIDFSENGISDIDAWNDFKQDAKDKKRCSVNIRIMKKNEVQNEVKLTFDGKNFKYGKGKEYKYLLDKTGKIDDFDLNLRCIVLSDTKYNFTQIYHGLANNIDTENSALAIGELNKSVEDLTNTLDNIDTEIDEGEDKNNYFFKESDGEDEEKESIEYEFIYCY